ncbi:MAG: class I SAM-dependent methyltransferase [Rhodanobacteraceae bacterium]
MSTESIKRARLRRSISSQFEDHWKRQYVRGKLWIDPVYQGAVRVFSGSTQPLLDIGCGMGLLGMFLARHDHCPDYVGVDSDPRKIASARAFAAGAHPQMQFIESDAGQLPEFSGDVALLDALHYMPRELQQRVLNAAAERVAPGGVLMIRNCLRDSSWRYWATVIEEKFLHWSSWMQVGAQHFPTREEIATPLEQHGLSVTVEPLWGHTPYNSYMILGRRPRGDSEQETTQ